MGNKNSVSKNVSYLAASDPQIATRNWQFVMDEMVKLRTNETQHRWQTADQGQGV